MLKPQAWNAIRRELLAKLQRELAPFAQAEAFDAAACRAATAPTVASLAQLTQDNLRYLARAFRGERKAEICAFHHQWMLANVAPFALIALIAGQVTLWSHEAAGTAYAVKLRVDRWVAREGELTLEMYGDRTPLYSLSFSLVPPGAVPLAAASAPTLLVSRLQGAKDRFEALRRATKALSEVAPRAAVFATLSGIARACGIGQVAGVAAENFITFAPERRDELARQYDEFFVALDAQGPQDGFYLVDLSAPPKPIGEVKPGHRIRTRRKRALKEEIAARTAAAWTREIAMPRGENREPANCAPSPAPPAPTPSA